MTTSSTTLERAFAIIEYFVTVSEQASVGELIHYLASNKATVSRTVSHLCDVRMLQRTSRGMYTLGPLTLDMRASYLRANPLRERLLNSLPEAARLVGGTIHLCRYRMPNEILVVAAADGGGVIQAVARLGEVLPLHASAAGKAIASSLSEEDLDGFSQHIEFEQYTPYTIGTWSQFVAGLDEGRRYGFFVADGEYHLELSAVAVPVTKEIVSDDAAVVAMFPRHSMGGDTLFKAGMQLRDFLTGLGIGPSSPAANDYDNETTQSMARGSSGASVKEAR